MPQIGQVAARVHRQRAVGKALVEMAEAREVAGLVVVAFAIVRRAGRQPVQRAHVGAGEILVAAVHRVAGESRESIRALARDRRAQAGVARRVDAVRGGLARRVAAVVEHDVRAGGAGAARDEVDHAADGVGAVDRGTRTFDDLDPLEQLGREILQRRSADRARVDAHTVDHDDGLLAVGAADEQRQRLAGTPAAADVEARMETQQVAHVDGERVLELRAVDEDDGLQHLRSRFRVARGRHHDLVQGVIRRPALRRRGTERTARRKHRPDRGISRQPSRDAKPDASGEDSGDAATAAVRSLRHDAVPIRRRSGFSVRAAHPGCRMGDIDEQVSWLAV